MTNILIAVPTNVGIEPETFKSIYDLDIPEGVNTTFQNFYGYRIDQIRNLIVEWGKNYDYTLFVDSDMVLPSDTITKFLYMFHGQSNLGVATGVYRQRKEETVLELYKLNDNGGHTNIPIDDPMLEYLGQDHIILVSACGFGCAMVKKEVFESVSYPHFDYKHAIDHKNTYSEDLYFCDKVLAYGYVVKANLGLVCDHIGKKMFSVSIPNIGEPTHLERIHKMDLLPIDHVEFLEDLSDELDEDSIIYDIGACVGHWSRHMKRVLPKSTIYQFDASRSTDKFMRKMVDEGMARGCYCGVLGEVSGTSVDFYEDLENPGGNSYYKETTGHYDNIEPERRTVYALDDIIEANSWYLPDLIKLDIQGAELDVLRGSPKCLAHANRVILEAQNTDYNKGAPKIDEIEEFMKEAGFEMANKFCEGVADADYYFKRV